MRRRRRISCFKGSNRRDTAEIRPRYGRDAAEDLLRSAYAPQAVEMRRVGIIELLMGASSFTCDGLNMCRLYLQVTVSS